jgi:L-cysteine:1D-myo-inositol 2-amino-2-deoxy-alpha-D-glucopyranoside ligase
MQSWREPALPQINEMAPVPRMFNTASSTKTELAGLGGRARMYVCGITPYDATHMGHAATYVAFDLLNRAWRNAGISVDFVQNVTDVDDPLLERAQATGVDWVKLAESEIALFHSDMEALEVIPPREYVGAVESIPLVIEMILELQRLGAVYEVDSDLYFEVNSDPSFGSISGLANDEMLGLFAERGGDPERKGKRHPLDCLLWQAERPEEPSWPSPFGPGRPGWHVECSAIARHHLGDSFDVQGGGSDLIFPHHEMSASEAQVANHGLPFALAYSHAGMVALDGEKMSKSKGNLVLVSRLRKSGEDPRAIRLALLNHHYRSDWEWFDADLAKGKEQLALWQQALSQPKCVGLAELARGVLEAMADDLDSPTAVGLVDNWAARTVRGEGTETCQAEVGNLISAALGITI